jgi:hypothetical protein
MTVRRHPEEKHRAAWKHPSLVRRQRERERTIRRTIQRARRDEGRRCRVLSDSPVAFDGPVRRAIAPAAAEPCRTVEFEIVADAAPSWWRAWICDALGRGLFRRVAGGGGFFASRSSTPPSDSFFPIDGTKASE